MSGSEIKEMPRMRYEKEPSQFTKEKNRRVSFANENQKGNSAQLKWCKELENAINSDDLRVIF
jgi:hypothetical protein